MNNNLNPVFRREIITALRSWRTFFAVSIYVGALLAIAALLLFVVIRIDFVHGFNPQSAITVYNLLSGIQLGLILLLVPAITAGQINGERERQTLDLMLVTKMSALTIVTGKLLSALMLVLLMILAGVPVFGVFVYFGAVSALNIMALTVFMLVTATMVGSVSILCSVLFRRTMIAYVASYFVVLALLAGTIAAAGITFYVLAASHDSRMHLSGGFVPFVLSTQWREIFTWLMSFNPLAGFMSLQDAQTGASSLESFLAVFIFRFTEVRLTSAAPLWLVNIVINMGLSCVFVAISAWALKPARRAVS